MFTAIISMLILGLINRNVEVNGGPVIVVIAMILDFIIIINVFG